MSYNLYESYDAPQKSIFIDMDGVLCDFCYGFLWAHGREDLMLRYENGEYPTDWNFHGDLGNEEDMWKPVRKAGIRFWLSLNPFEWTKNIISLVSSYGVPWYVCTTPYFLSDCYKGKVEWLHTNIDKDLNNIIMIKDKFLLANKNTYLVDDSDANYRKFINHGGNGFLFPQPWNEARDSMNTRFSLLKFHLDEFVNSQTEEEQCLKQKRQILKIR